MSEATNVNAVSTPMPGPKRFRRLSRVHAAIMGVGLAVVSAEGQTVKPMRTAAAVEPVQNEPPAKLIVDPPLADPLSRGRIVVPYRIENLRPIPVFGPAALDISPRVGHIHVSIDDASWVWADTSGEPVILNGLTPGRHKIRLQLMSPNHQPLDEGSVTFIVPERQLGTSGGSTAATPPQNEPAAKLIVDSPLAEPLSRGVIFLPYRTENLRILPVFGRAALAVAPRIGHIHVTVDDAPWHWADASGVPIIVSGLPAGKHKLLIELVNANHQRIDQSTVDIVVPAANARGPAH